MKKLGLFFVSLMTISLLSSCNSNKPDPGPVNIYTVSFDSDGGSNVPSQQVEENKCATKPDNPTKEAEEGYEYTFNEWQLDGTKYDFSTPVTKDITLKATYTHSPITYTITYKNLDRATKNDNPSSYTVETETIELKDPEYDKKLFVYKGWYLFNGGKATPIKEITKGEHIGNLLIYAGWGDDVQYSITYANLKEGATTDNPPTFNPKTTKPFTLKNPIGDCGYSFTGWHLDSPSGDIITEFNPLLFSSNVTIYASWGKATEYTITYHLNDGKDPGNPKSYTVESETIKLKDATRDGYIFEGWYTDSLCTQKITEINPSAKTNFDIYAKWSDAITYSITYYLNDGKDPGNPTSYTVESETITLKASTKTGYNFEGWFTDAEFKNKITEITKGSTGNKTIYAKWSNPITYKITYELNDGDNDPDNPKSYTVETPTITFKDATKTGHEFNGWYTTKTFDQGTEITEIKKGSTGDKTVFAKFTINEYELTFDANGGNFTNGGTKTIDVTYNTEWKNINNKPIPTKEGHSYYWSLSKDNPSEIPDNWTMPASATTVYAIWTKNKYDLTFNANGGTIAGETTIKVDYGTAWTEIAKPTPTREGHNKYQWSTDPNQLVPIPDTWTMPASNFTVYAYWTINTYNVTFNSDGGSQVSPQTINWGEKATKPTPDPTKQEDDIFTYKFDNWYQIDKEGVISDKPFSFDTPIKENINLIAKWTSTRKQYEANATDTTNLTFTTTSDAPLTNIDVNAGLAFSFKMEANGDGYKVPTSLKIILGESDIPLADGYTITPNEDNTEASVTINGDKVIDDIAITGEAVGVDYHYQVTYGYGIENIPKGTHDLNSPLTLTFTPSSKETSNDTYTLPKAENVYIKFDNVPGDNPVQWISPVEEGREEYCSYNEETGDLTILPNHIKSNIEIAVRANDYPLLEKLSWDQIDKVSTAGAAKYVFYLGEEKTVTLLEDGVEQNFAHTVRIIDFDKDTITIGKKIGITFEFVNVITKSDGKAFTTVWDTISSGDSFYSSLNYTLQPGGSVYQMIPSDLLNVIKNSERYYDFYFGEWSTGYGRAQLFSFSTDEIDGNDDGTYEFYRTDSKNKRKKGMTYWTRSTGRGNLINALSCRDTGEISSLSILSNFAVAPAFCI